MLLPGCRDCGKKSLPPSSMETPVYSSLEHWYSCRCGTAQPYVPFDECSMPNLANPWLPPCTQYSVSFSIWTLLILCIAKATPRGLKNQTYMGPHFAHGRCKGRIKRMDVGPFSCGLAFGSCKFSSHASLLVSKPQKYSVVHSRGRGGGMLLSKQNLHSQFIPKQIQKDGNTWHCYGVLKTCGQHHFEFYILRFHAAQGIPPLKFLKLQYV